MLNLFANWKITTNPGIYVDGQPAFQFLVLGIALLIIAVLLEGIFGYYLWKFTKQKAEVKFVNKPLIMTTFALPVISMIFAVIMLIFWSAPLSIFGANGGDNLFAAYISVAVIGFLTLIISIVLMWIWLPKYAIALTNNQILFVGDAIPYSRIKKVVKDTETGNLYVNYTLGKRTLKKQKFPLTSVSGQFLLANAGLTGHDVEEISQNSYVESFETKETFSSETPITVEPTVKEDNVVEPIVDEVKPVEQKVEPKKPVSAKKATAAKKPVAKKAANPIGKPVPKPKPVVVEEELEVEIKKHPVPKYKDKDNK